MKFHFIYILKSNSKKNQNLHSIEHKDNHHPLNNRKSNNKDNNTKRWSRRCILYALCSGGRRKMHNPPLWTQSYNNNNNNRAEPKEGPPGFVSLSGSAFFGNKSLVLRSAYEWLPGGGCALRGGPRRRLYSDHVPTRLGPNSIMDTVSGLYEVFCLSDRRHNAFIVCIEIGRC